MENIMPTQKRGLGRGLSALIPTPADEKSKSPRDHGPRDVAVESITPSLAHLKENFISPPKLFAMRKSSDAIYKKLFRHGPTAEDKPKKKKKM